MTLAPTQLHSKPEEREVRSGDAPRRRSDSSEHGVCLGLYTQIWTPATPRGTRDIRKVNAGELLTKQATREKMLYTKKITYILKLHLNVVTAGIETLVVSGNKFLYACVKVVRRLWAQPRFDTFHQLIIIVMISTSSLGR
jgi:hypothetical protein